MNDHLDNISSLLCDVEDLIDKIREELIKYAHENSFPSDGIDDHILNRAFNELEKAVWYNVNLIDRSSLKF